MSLVLQVVFVLLRVFDVHVARVPVALFRNTLWTPVGPDSELGVLIPFRSLVTKKRIPGCCIWTAPVESKYRRLHWNAIPGIQNSRQLLRSSPGIRFP